jgi:protocatechuate 3,4-dioxygenase beta subunit
MKRLFVFVMLLGLGLGIASAQELTTGTLEGLVTDKDGNAIEGAIVTLMGPQGIKVSETNKRGEFNFAGLSPGVYKCKAEAAGHATVVQSDVQISINRKTQLPFVLAAGVTEEITVVSQGTTSPRTSRWAAT